jgi:ribosomal protein S12 methylthiotransferase accessory factor YcaO
LSIVLSLAAFRYRNVLASAGGPIERLEIADVTVLGERRFLANAYLVAALAGNREDCSLYSRANGSGTAASPMVARFMAISEAMERWAHWELHQSPGRHKYGFDVDPSSNGLSAFPGLWRRQSRQGALLEAAERFNLLNWWEGRLTALESETRWPGVHAATLCSQAPGITVILFKRTGAGFFAYGHAAAMDFDTACLRAAGEMERHAQVVTRFALNHAGNIRNQLPASAHPLERRSLFFAREEGHELFLERLRSPVRAEAKLRLVYDGPVPGPWTRYADVWRVAYAPPSRRFLGMEENYFML